MRAALWIAVALALGACANPKQPAPEEQQAARESTVCLLGGQRFVVRVTEGEARMLMPTGERIVLYQIAAATGQRFTNGIYEIRGSGNAWQLIRDGTLQPLSDCKPYEIPVPK